MRKICKTLHLFCDTRNMYVVPDASKLLLSRFDPSSWADSFDNPKSLGAHSVALDLKGLVWSYWGLELDMMQMCPYLQARYHYLQ